MRKAGVYKNGFKGKKNEGLIPIREAFAFARQKKELERMKQDLLKKQKEMERNSRGVRRRLENAQRGGSPIPPQPKPKPVKQADDVQRFEGILRLASQSEPPQAVDSEI